MRGIPSEEHIEIGETLKNKQNIQYKTENFLQNYSNIFLLWKMNVRNFVMKYFPTFMLSTLFNYWLCNVVK